MNSRLLARRIFVALALLVTNVAALGATTYSLTRDFAVSSNPNGVWSYGYTPTVGGAFTLMAAPRTDEVPSIPIWSWSVDGISSPDVHFNASSNNTFLAEGGTFPPRSLWVSPGHEGSSNAFAVMRFTAPMSGLYRVQTLAQSYLDEFSGDADFHVATNGTEVISAFLAAGAQRISTSNQFRLNVGSVVDLIVGRGRDGALYRSALKLEGEITLLQTNGPVPPPPSTNAIPAPSGVVAWWPFEGSGADISGRGHPMQLFGSPAFGAGKVRHALVVGDANDYGRVGPHPDMDLGANLGLTTELWINPENTEVQQPLLEWTDNDSIVGLHFWISVVSGAGGGNGSLFANLIDRNGVAHHVSSAPGVVTANTFTHVAMSYSKASGLAKLYANGQLVASTNFGNITPETRHSLYAGWRPIGGEWRYKGKLDEITLYNRELAGHEINAIFLAGVAGKTNGIVPPNPTNPPPPSTTGTYDLARDFALHNPNGVWSYGHTPVLAGPFTPMAVARSNELPSIPIWSWSVDGFSSPDVHWNASSSNTFFQEGVAFPPGTLWVSPGHESSSNAFGVIRFTAPSNGLYRIQTTARAYLDGASGDSDFHVLRNGTELFGQFLPAGAHSVSYSNAVQLAVGNTVDFLVGRGMDGLLYASALKLEAVISQISSTPGATNPPPNLSGFYDLSHDFALLNNPSGVWSYGWKSNFTAPLGLLADVRTFGADNGVSIRAWELTTMNLPVVAKVLGPDTAVSDGGRFVAPAGTVYFAPGSDGTAQNYGVIRFRVPTSGVYRVETTVSQLFGSDRSRDSDFHVLRNGFEVFGAFLPPNSGTNFSGQFLMPSGATIDFLVGRGADGLTADSGLKIAARIFRVTNSPPVTNQPPTPVARDFDVSRDFAISNNPTGPWSYGWKSNFTGSLSLLADVRTFSADNGVSILAWERATFSLPVVAKVVGPGTAISDNGNFTAPAGTVYFAPGADNTPHNYGIIRFTSPSNGVYHIHTSVQQVFDNARSRDSDFHVLKNGVELFGAFLPPQSGTNYSANLTLGAGEALEFAVGRGADGLTADSALKITAFITPGSNNIVAPNPPPPTNALVSLWRANGDATDSVGTNHGTLVNAVGFAPGMDGQAFVLNGASHIRVPDASSLDFTQSLSISLWFNRDTNLPFGTAFTLLDKRDLGSCNYGANMSENYGLTVFYDPTNGGFENLFAPLPTGGVWHHFVSTYSQTTSGVRVMTYLDGVIVASNRLSGTLASTVNNAPLSIGSARDGASDFFVGLIDEVALYRRALSLAEVQAAYNSIPPTVNGEAVGISSEGFKFTLKGRPGSTYLIEISEDLQTWNTLTNVVCPGEKVSFCDPLLSQRPRTFYRARLTNP